MPALPPEVGDDALPPEVGDDALPPQVADDELVVRVIKSPHHVNGGKTKVTKRAFHPPPNHRELSVIRQRMSDDFCKDKGVEIVGTQRDSRYLGLAVGVTGIVRNLGAEVEDFRSDFLGHAHIVTEYPRVGSGDPPESKVLERLDALFQQLVNHFIFYKDAAPDAVGWSGPPLVEAHATKD